MKDKLTLQELELLNTASAYNGEQHKAICGKAALELIEYKKIEEELGIDLITYFKLFQTTKVWAYSNNGKCEVTLTGVNPCGKMVDLWNGVCYIEYPLNEYGKSFALTKEELK